MGNAQERPSETIDRERKRLVETLQADSGLLLDALLARGVLTGPEYEALDALPDAERRVRRLLLVVQSKGEAACQELLLCAQRTTRAPDPTWDWQHATGSAAMTLLAQATGRLRQPAREPYVPDCPELQNATKLGVLRAPRQCNAALSRSPSQSWKLSPLKKLSQSWNSKWIRNQSPSPNWSQSRTSRRGTSLKIPEDQNADRPLPAQAGWDSGYCSGGVRRQGSIWPSTTGSE
nr:nucleolar protein 3 isoform X2 [Equus asinus]